MLAFKGIWLGFFFGVVYGLIPGFGILALLGSLSMSFLPGLEGVWESSFGPMAFQMLAILVGIFVFPVAGAIWFTDNKKPNKTRFVLTTLLIHTAIAYGLLAAIHVNEKPSPTTVYPTPTLEVITPTTDNLRTVKLDEEQPTPQESSSPTATPVPTPMLTPTPMGAEYLRRGRQYHHVDQDYDKAIENFTEFIALNPDHPVGYYERAVTHLELRQWQQALDNYTAAINLNLGIPAAYVQRGNIYSERHGEYEKALQDYEKALELDPDYMWAHHYKGSAHRELHQYQKAIQSFEKYVELRLIESAEWIESEQAVNAHIDIGKIYIELSQYEKAIEHFDIALKTDPDNAAAQDSRQIALDYIDHRDDELEERTP